MVHPHPCGHATDTVVGHKGTNWMDWGRFGLGWIESVKSGWIESKRSG
jgi:hypothetical protein